MPSLLPRQVRWKLIRSYLPIVFGLPRISGGSAPATPFSRPAQRSLGYGLQICRVTFATLCTGGFSSFVASTTAPVATGWSEPVPGWDFHPLWISTFPRRTERNRLALTFVAAKIVECRGSGTKLPSALGRCYSSRCPRASKPRQGLRLLSFRGNISGLNAHRQHDASRQLADDGLAQRSRTRGGYELLLPYCLYALRLKRAGFL